MRWIVIRRERLFDYCSEWTTVHGARVRYAVDCHPRERFLLGVDDSPRSTLAEALEKPPAVPVDLAEEMPQVPTSTYADIYRYSVICPSSQTSRPAHSG